MGYLFILKYSPKVYVQIPIKILRISGFHEIISTNFQLKDKKIKKKSQVVRIS